MVAPQDYRSVGYVGPKTRKANTKDDKLARDRDAYKRLRDDGLKPSHVGGSDHIERHADMPIEVEMGWVAKTKQGKALAREGVERSLELGVRERWT
jgi:ribosomal protein S19E (S16A)